MVYKIRSSDFDIYLQVINNKSSSFNSPPKPTIQIPYPFRFMLEQRMKLCYIFIHVFEITRTF